MLITQRSNLVRRCPGLTSTARPLTASRSGLSTVEILIGLALGAMLFAALTTAISAGIGSAQANYDYFTTVQRARIALLRISSDLRNCYAADLEEGSDKALVVQASLTSGRVAYRYVNTTLYPNQFRHYANADDPLDVGTRLASNVTSMTIEKQTRTVGSTILVTNISITMTIGSGRDSLTLCESVAPRYVMSAK